MKPSSYFVLFGIVALFVLIQGWIVLDRFWYPRPIPSEEAILMGTVLSVGTPTAGIVREVRVYEGQWVREGTVLFVVTPQSPNYPNGGNPVVIPAPRTGTVTDLGITQGDFVQASELLARIVDDNPDSQYVVAEFAIEPGDRSLLRPLMPAWVTAPHLNGGKRLAAIVTSVSPLYDSETQTLEVRLRLVEDDRQDTLAAIGLPVNVTLELPNENAFKDLMIRVAERITPPSLAR